MAGRNPNAGTPIDAGIIARVTQSVRYMLSGRAPDGWFGPSQPLAPVAQEEAEGRAFDYAVGYNLRLTPRSEEPITFGHMRALADGCDLVRLAIETRKDQLCRMKWKIRPRDEKKEAEDDARCQALQDFFLFPDREHDWQTWLRMLMEDMLVIDAPTIYPRLTRGKGIYSLDLIDGATIKRVLSVDGRTPIAPDPAYQQIIKGLPAVDYSRDELLYMPRNPRTYKVYGFSPVEQIITTINIALRRQTSVLHYYTEGNIPDAIYTVPETWAPQQIKEFQTYWDALLEGNSEARRHAKFVPGGITMGETRNPTLKDEHDEWLARIVCFAFSLPPTAFVRQVNRATAETAVNSADEEGLAPTMLWVKSAIDQLIGRWFAMPDLEFTWEEEEAPNPLEQAQINQIYLSSKVLHPDEVREQIGKDPLTEEQKTDMNPEPVDETTGEKGDNKKPTKEANGDAEKLSKKKDLRPSTVTGQRLQSRVRRYAKL